MRIKSETTPGSHWNTYGSALAVTVGAALIAFSMSSPATAASSGSPDITLSGTASDFGPDAQVYDQKKKKKKKKKKRRGSFYSG